MAWRFVLQPDAKLAVFSDVVDSFTYCNLSKEEAVRVCVEDHGMSDRAAEDKVQAGLDDIEPFSTKPGGGLARWNDCIETVRLVHGDARADRFLALDFGEG